VGGLPFGGAGKLASALEQNTNSNPFTRASDAFDCAYTLCTDPVAKEIELVSALRRTYSCAN
jgi:hypothetical protein